MLVRTGNLRMRDGDVLMRNTFVDLPTAANLSAIHHVFRPFPVGGSPVNSALD